MMDFSGFLQISCTEVGDGSTIEMYDIWKQIIINLCVQNIPIIFLSFDTKTAV